MPIWNSWLKIEMNYHTFLSLLFLGAMLIILPGGCKAQVSQYRQKHSHSFADGCCFFFFVEHTVCHSWCLLRVIGVSGPGVAVLSDVAVQTLIQDLPVLYRCIMCQLCYAFSAHAYERRDSRLCAYLPWLGMIYWIAMKGRDKNIMQRTHKQAHLWVIRTTKKKVVCLLPQVLEYFHSQRLNRFLQDAGTTLKFKACFGCYSIAYEYCGSRLGSLYFCVVKAVFPTVDLQERRFPAALCMSAKR